MNPQPGGYGSGVDVVDVDSASGGGIVTSEIFDGENTNLLPTHAVLPVDMVFDGSSFAVVAAGNGHTKSLPQVFVLPSADNFDAQPSHLDVQGQATSIALLPSGTSDVYAVLSREPAQLELLPSGTIIPLSGVSREDTGHAIFHSNSGSGLACASCHGEARDDGHVWNFFGIGERTRPPSSADALSSRAQRSAARAVMRAPIHESRDVRRRHRRPVPDPIAPRRRRGLLISTTDAPRH